MVSNWRDRAACRVIDDPELFFPNGTTGTAWLQIEDAKAVCRRCPVLASCGAWVLANPSLTEHGVWAGVSQDERQLARRRAAKERQRAAARLGGAS